MSKRARQLTEDGVESFRQYLHALRMDGTLPPPYELLDNSDASCSVRGQAFVENIGLGTRLHAARYLVRALDNLDPNEYENNNMWTWLSLFYFDQLCPKNSKGLRKPGKDYRYVASSDYRYHYRHLLAGPFRLYFVHGNNARIFLSNDITKPGDINESLASRQDLISSPTVIGAVDAVYYSEKREHPKQGCTSKSKARPGTIRRFVSVLSQLSLTYDARSMASEELISLLPSEFSEFLQGD